MVLKVVGINNRRLGVGGRQINDLSEGGEKEGTLRRPAGADKENVLEVLHPKAAARAGGEEACMEAPQSSQAMSSKEVASPGSNEGNTASVRERNEAYGVKMGPGFKED